MNGPQPTSQQLLFTRLHSWSPKKQQLTRQGKSTQNLCAVVLTLTHTDTAKRQYFRLAMIAHALCYGAWKLPDVDVSSQTQFVTNIVCLV